jgi:tRNA(His) 5'-end guanylyltransferase
MKKPFDEGMIRVMDQTAIELCKRIQGAKCAYVQSDEISIVLTDFDSRQTDAWFDGNIQKIASVSASIATAHFNNGMYLDEDILANMDKIAYFDARVFTIPQAIEVKNYLIWRQQDATRNSIHMVARSLASHKECNNLDTDQLQELIFQRGQNWNDYPEGQKRGRLIAKTTYEKEAFNPMTQQTDKILRTKWSVVNTPIFSQDLDVLNNIIPGL